MECYKLLLANNMLLDNKANHLMGIIDDMHDKQYGERTIKRVQSMAVSKIKHVAKLNALGI